MKISKRKNDSETNNPIEKDLDDVTTLENKRIPSTADLCLTSKRRKIFSPERSEGSGSSDSDGVENSDGSESAFSPEENGIREVSKSTYQGERPYECLHCEKRFKSSANVHSHIAYNHRSEKPWECDICPKTFGQWSWLHQHLKTTHEVSQPEKESYAESAKKVKNRSLRNENKKQGTELNEKRPYECLHCGKRFNSSVNVRSHIAHNHRSEKPWECDLCPKKFGQWKWLHQHLKTTHKVSQSKKESYVKSGTKVERSSFQSEYKNHDVFARNKVTEVDEKRSYECLHCGKKFSTSSNVRQHILCYHNSERPWECDICPKKFPNWSMLHHHLKTTHKVSQSNRASYVKSGTQVERRNLQSEYKKHDVIMNDIRNSATNLDVPSSQNLAKDVSVVEALEFDLHNESVATAIPEEANVNIVLDMRQNSVEEIPYESGELTVGDVCSSNRLTRERQKTFYPQRNECSDISDSDGDESSGGSDSTYQEVTISKSKRSATNKEDEALGETSNAKKKFRRASVNSSNNPSSLKPDIINGGRNKVTELDEKRSYECLHCGKKFSTSSNVRQHILCCHNSERPWECDICPKKFGQWKWLHQHLKTTHKVSQSKKESYVKSGTKVERSSFQSEYKNHDVFARNKVTEVDEKRSYECLHCGNKFSTSSNVRQHILCCHNSERPWECDICPKKFPNWSMLHHHLKTTHKVSQSNRASYVKSGTQVERRNLQSEYKKHDVIMNDIRNSATNLDVPSPQNLAKDVSVVEALEVDLHNESVATAIPEEANVNIVLDMSQNSVEEIPYEPGELTVGDVCSSNRLTRERQKTFYPQRNECSDNSDSDGDESSGGSDSTYQEVTISKSKRSATNKEDEALGETSNAKKKFRRASVKDSNTPSNVKPDIINGGSNKVTELDGFTLQKMAEDAHMAQLVLDLDVDLSAALPSTTIPDDANINVNYDIGQSAADEEPDDPATGEKNYQPVSESKTLFNSSQSITCDTDSDLIDGDSGFVGIGNNKHVSKDNSMSRLDCRTDEAYDACSTEMDTSKQDSSLRSFNNLVAVPEFCLDVNIRSRDIKYIEGTSQYIIETFAKKNMYRLYLVWHEMFNLDIVRSVAANWKNTILFVKKFAESQFDLFTRLKFGSVQHHKVYIGNELPQEIHCFTFGKEFLMSNEDYGYLFPDFEKLESELTSRVVCDRIHHIIDQDWSYLLIKELKKDIIVSTFSSQCL